MPSIVTRMKAHFGKGRLTDGSQGTITDTSTGKSSLFFGKNAVAKEPLLNDEVLSTTNTSTEASAEHAEFISSPSTLNTFSTKRAEVVNPAKKTKVLRFDTENIPVYVVEHPDDYHYDVREKLREMEYNRRASKVQARCEGICKDKQRRAEICGPQRAKVQAKVQAAKVAGNLFL